MQLTTVRLLTQFYSTSGSEWWREVIGSGPGGLGSLPALACGVMCQWRGKRSSRWPLYVWVCFWDGSPVVGRQTLVRSMFWVSIFGRNVIFFCCCLKSRGRSQSRGNKMQTSDRNAGQESHAEVWRWKGAVLPFSHGVVLSEGSCGSAAETRTGCTALTWVSEPRTGFTRAEASSPSDRRAV